MSTKITITEPNWQAYHLELYLRTDGAEGHFVDFSPVGGSVETPNLILKTTGKRSGQARLVPLIYGKDGGNYIIVASKGGAPKDPAWFLNLEANPDIELMVKSDKWRGKAIIAEGAERQRLFDMMAGVYPPYVEYAQKTERQIPVVVLKPEERIEKL